MFDMDATPIIGASLLIGSSIFMYIVAFLAVMAVGGYLTYRSGAKTNVIKTIQINNRSENMLGRINLTFKAM